MLIDGPSKASKQCKRGHTVSDAGLYRHPTTGQQECKQCRKERASKRYNIKLAHRKELEAICHEVMRSLAVQHQQPPTAQELQQPLSDNQQPSSIPADSDLSEPVEPETPSEQLDRAIGEAIDEALAQGEPYSPALQHRIEQEITEKYNKP